MNEYKIEDFLEIRRSFGASLSPDGSRVAFLSNLSGTNQIYLIRRDGGVAEQLTAYKEPISGYSFSPVKNELLFSMTNGGNERYQLYLLNTDSLKTERLTNNDEAIYRMGGWSYNGKFVTYSSNERNGTDFDIFVMNVATKEVWCIFDKGGWCDALGFSPDGKRVSILKQYTFLHHDLFIYDLGTGVLELATSHQGNAEYGRPRWLPDSSGFFFASNEAKEFFGVSFYDVAMKTRKSVLDFSWDVEELALSDDGDILAVDINEDGYGNVKFYDSKIFTEISGINLPSGILSGLRWSKDSQYLVFSRISDTMDDDVWLWSRKENVSRQLVVSSSKVSQEVFVEASLMHYPSFDGRQIPAFIYLPKNSDGKKVPAIIDIHGGPEGQSRPIFDALTQYFLYRGYAVVVPNVRGSTGYGKAYLALDDREKRMDSVRDLEYLHKALAQRNDIDLEKIALLGGSYGGYMVLAGLAFQPELWAAGIDIVGIANLTTFLQNTSSWRRALREAEYGYLDKDQEILKKFSPINSIQNVKTPLFIIHGANDPRVPLSEAEQMRDQLKALGREVELLVYPDEGHGLSKLKNRIDAYPKVAAFLDKHLMEK
jgi:dipeptidyl aminopeptidase/acylaminoacyl peptidase